MQTNPNRIAQYLKIAEGIIRLYDGVEPFHLFLKKYFANNRKHGSRDRKEIARFCYLYFRVGNGVIPDFSFEKRIQIALFLCEVNPNAYLEIHQPEWNRNISLPLAQKLDEVADDFNLTNVFSWNQYLSEQINVVPWYASFLSQPNLYIRVRPGKKEKVISQLNNAQIQYKTINENVLVFAPYAKLDKALELDKDAVVQDYNSQRIGELIENCGDQNEGILNVWDCCAASGGKSILALDILKDVNLTVSDKRKGILNNLRDRFLRAGIRNYQSFMADLSVDTELPVAKNHFDLIIADVPCTGSGTWARTPEWLHYFQSKEIDQYALLQRKIVQNVASYLKPGGKLLYSTCSVFKDENESNIAFFESELRFKKLKSIYFPGYEMQADTLFATMLIKK